MPSLQEHFLAVATLRGPELVHFLLGIELRIITLQSALNPSLLWNASHSAGSIYCPMTGSTYEAQTALENSECLPSRTTGAVPGPPLSSIHRASWESHEHQHLQRTGRETGFAYLLVPKVGGSPSPRDIRSRNDRLETTWHVRRSKYQPLFQGPAVSTHINVCLPHPDQS